MTRGEVEEKVASNIRVQGSNPGRDCPVCEIFKLAKTDDIYVKILTKTDQNDEKNVRALIGFGEVKATIFDDFLCLNPNNFSSRVIMEHIGIGNIGLRACVDLWSSFQFLYLHLLSKPNQLNFFNLYH